MRTYIRTLLLFCSAVLLQACTASLIQKTAEFENKHWLVQSFDYNDIANADGKIYIEFNRSEKTIKGFGGCNHILGSYSLTGSDITIKPVRSKENCPGTIEVENRFMQLLEKAIEFREITSSDKDYLRLITKDGSSIELRKK